MEETRKDRLVQLNVRVPESLDREVKIEAAKRRIKLQEFVAAALRLFLDKVS